MSAGVVNAQIISKLDFGKRAIYGKFIVVFAQAAGNIVDVSSGAFSFPSTVI